MRRRIDQIAAGPGVKHRRLGGAQAPFRRRQPRLQQRHHIVGRIFMGRRRQPRDLGAKPGQRLLEKGGSLGQKGVDGAMALIGLAHRCDRAADQTQRHAGLQQDEARRDADQIRLGGIAFTRFLGDGRVCLTNNAAERALRGIAVGRRNWTFAGSNAGGRRAAAVYTLIETCKLNDIDPQAWLADVLARLPDHPAKQIDDLLPWKWRERQLAGSAAA